MAEADTCGTA
jgi:hypothetical protein